MTASWPDMSDLRQALPAITPSFPFIRLPPVIRYHIYGLVLPTSARLAPPLPDPATTRSPYALARVCRLIRDEFSVVFYRRARLAIEVKPSVMPVYYNWRRTVDERLIAHVKHLTIDAAIETERVMEWRRRPDRPHKGGWFYSTRLFALKRYCIRYDTVVGTWEVSTENMGWRKTDGGGVFLESDQVQRIVQCFHKVPWVANCQHSYWRNVPGVDKDLRRALAADGAGQKRVLEKSLVDELVKKVYTLQFLSDRE
ncbi:MAG: hypothetical protein LQ348_005062 [Seirophora lacunosa]|nr:MAG: hypothetical protein LQ348_005062 [Seirophora lacunosa]